MVKRKRTTSSTSKQVVKKKKLNDSDDDNSATTKIDDDDLKIEHYDVMLNQTNIGQNNNKYYKLCIDPSSLSVVAEYGRVGYKAQRNVKNHSSEDTAIAAFKKQFLSKTGNHWKDRHDFVPKSRKYTIVKLAELDDVNEDKIKNSKKKHNVIYKTKDSALEERLKDLIELISNKNMLIDTMKTLNIDLDKLPLGAINKKQIKIGYQILKDIQDVIDGSNIEDNLVDLSSEFYSNIPHAFGRSTPPVIKTAIQIKEKLELIQTLDDLETANDVLSKAEGRGKEQNEESDDEDEKEKIVEVEHPVDNVYNSLNVELKPVDKDSDEFELVEQYTKKTHAPTHSGYTLEVLDIFKLEKQSETEGYEEWKEDKNRMLLFHGSGLGNWMGILKNSLKIAPPEAPATGYMFGKGVYFADMSSKSANYCRTSPSSNIGLMTLCEVALGDMLELTGAHFVTPDYIEQRNKQSTWGKGRVVPNPDDVHYTEDGVKVPYGEPKNISVKNSSLNYNEYIVYNTNQIKMRYLLKLKFNYKRGYY